MSKPASHYDVVIIGSGIAGLHVATELLRHHRRLRVAVFEREANLGGRASTFHHELPDGTKLQWERGAGRISREHKLVLGLLRRYKQPWMPIGAALRFKAAAGEPVEPNLFEPALPVMMDSLAGLPPDELATHTLRQLLVRIHGAARTDAYLIRFPYRAELEVMRADLALNLFKGEMGSHEGYGVAPKGLSALVEAMRAEFVRRGGQIFSEAELVGVGPDGATCSFRLGPASEGVGRPDVEVQGDHVVLALPCEAVRRLKGVEWRGLRHLTMTPLLRFYMVFPTKEGEDGKRHSWFEGLEGRLVTAGPLRYIIPNSAEAGSIQISYTDTQDARHWMEKLKREGEKAVGEEILLEARRLWEPSIPGPRLVRAHAWEEGVSYWLPGRYSAVDMSREAWAPFADRPALHLCGESYSLRQGWMEGALEHAEGLLRLLERKIRAKK